jgi:acyl dehydratase
MIEHESWRAGEPGMEMDSSFVGSKFSGPGVDVTWPAIDSANPDHRARRRLSPEIARTSVHATEHLIFHRLIRPGDRLKVRGEFVAVRPTSAVVHSVTRLEVTNEDEGALFTEDNGNMFRGIRVKDAGRGLDQIPASPGWDASEKPIWDVEIPVAAEMAHLYDGCTEIVFPIHTSRAFALDVGLPGIILQGTCTLALAARSSWPLARRPAGPAEYTVVGLLLDSEIWDELPSRHIDHCRDLRRVLDRAS